MFLPLFSLLSLLNSSFSDYDFCWLSLRVLVNNPLDIPPFFQFSNTVVLYSWADILTNYSVHSPTANYWYKCSIFCFLNGIQIGRDTFACIVRIENPSCITWVLCFGTQFGVSFQVQKGSCLFWVDRPCREAEGMGIRPGRIGFFLRDWSLETCVPRLGVH